MSITYLNMQDLNSSYPDKVIVDNRLPKQKRLHGKEQKDWNLKEVDLSKPIYDYFTAKGYKAVSEYHSHDWMFFNNQEIICCELKKGVNKKVIEQCNDAYYCNRKYCAVNLKPTKISIKKLKNEGIGLIHVVNNEINVIVEAKSQNACLASSKFEELNKYWEKYGNSEPDSAGKPNLKGTGPAQAVLEQIKLYVKENPSADWKEIYKNIPTHYSNYKSLCGAMRCWQKFNLFEYKQTLLKEGKK